MSKFNKELIEKLQRGEIALEYDCKSLDELRAILKEAFPDDPFEGGGKRRYYEKMNNRYYLGVKTTKLPTKPIKDFILQEFPEKWAIKLYPEVKQWIKKEFKSSYYRDDSVNYYFHFPNYVNCISFSESCHTANYIKDEYKEITLEQFKEHILKEKTMYKYTVQYVKNNKVAIHVNSLEEIEKIKDLTNPTSCENYNYYFDNSIKWHIHFKNDRLNINSLGWEPIKEYEIIEAEDFIKNNTKECNMENKKIIGYLAPYDLEYGKSKKGDLFILESSNLRYFNAKSGICVPKEIVEQWEAVYSSNLPKINGIEGKIENNRVIYGCQSYLVEDLKLLLQNWKTFKFDNIIKINSYEICKTELEQVLNAVKNI